MLTRGQKAAALIAPATIIRDSLVILSRSTHIGSISTKQYAVPISELEMI
jgi:hypothetical protein